MKRIFKNCGTISNGVNIHLIREEMNEKKEIMEEIFEVKMNVNFPELMQDTKSQIQESQRTLSRMNIKASIFRHNTFNLQNIRNKEKS